MSLVIDPEFENVLGPLKEDELELLEKSLLQVGCRDPLIAGKVAGSTGYVLLDGHNRYKICQKHKISYVIQSMPRIMDREEAIDWIIRNNLARRNLQDKSDVRVRYYERMKNKHGGDRKSEKARENQSEEKLRLDATITGQPRKEVGKVAENFGVSTRQLQHDAKWVRDKEKVRALFPDLTVR